MRTPPYWHTFHVGTEDGLVVTRRNQNQSTSNLLIEQQTRWTFSSKRQEQLNENDRWQQGKVKQCPLARQRRRTQRRRRRREERGAASPLHVKGKPFHAFSLAPRACLAAAKRKRPPFKERCDKRARPQEGPPPAQVGRRLKADIKTSSLFRHNPEIPQVRRADVCPLTEKIFTSESFSDLDLHPHLVATLNKVLNVSTLTSVQKQSIPALLSGRDAVVRSQTGSGKTLSYAVPLVQSLQGLPTKVRRSDGPLALVVVPTRELAQQTFGTFQRLLKPFTWIVPGVLMGGEKRKSEKARLRKGINILVATPGRLVDHIQHTASIAFGAVRWLVLDEADRTLDLGFEKDLSIILNSLNATGSERQNVLLSATLTQGVTRLADICLKDPISVQVHEPASPPDRPAPSATPCATTSAATTAEGQWENFALPTGLRHFAVVVPSKVRLVCLATFLLHACRGKKAMVFVSSCEEVDFLHTLFCGVLSAKLGGPLFLRLHGSMCQEERSEAFGDFLASEHRVLLCTDVAARGLHLPEVTWIIQYTPPCSVAEYVHRAGRTARMGLAGSTLLFLTPGESAFVDELARGGISLSEMKLPDILAHLMKDDAFKGRGKYRSQTSHGALEMETRERATILQTHFEDFVHADATSLRNAKKALGSYLRSYATYPARLKHVFHIRALHLGHAAKSFGLRDAPRDLADGARGGGGPRGAPSAAKARHKLHRLQQQSAKAAAADEFSAGLQFTTKKKKREEPQETD
ncbi:ATP-dependent DNA helicase DDX31 isoform X2 [Syngnathus scovelli]|uniref:ATP-dependent DNA helicase DDX31 isoform X2 n=1 Tax=Syngnathus scovelli TaxID=161590 RepID=UPI0021100308|nr:probable ATP-dependent RNA helicase DDX31 isoform X2 [Syngnathus scovelli]